ncbi:MAG: response regulator [Sphingomonas sp.]|nr:response regulator [Sphingomonas sp.]
MVELLAGFLTGRYAPHGYCLLWQPELVWTHVVSDLLIALAYFSIPIALATFARQRRDVSFGWMIWLFAVFILACGTSHLMQIWNLWHGDYGVEAVVKAVTAMASVPTAILLWRLIPQALALPSPTQLQVANRALAALVAERDAALANLQDEIAQRERAEEALVQARKIDAIGQLTGGIAHDFNNLLQAVAGNLDLIARQADDAAKVARWAENGLKGVERGTKLTSQLLAFSRVQRLELKPIDVNALVRGMDDLIRGSIGAPIAFDVVLDPAPCRVESDQTQLELAILNLAINARDAMPDGGRLTIATRQRDITDNRDLVPGSYLEIAVQDSGKGMSPEVARRAFEPFFTTKDVGQGTGLGLSMAFGVARQSGGTLLLETAPGQGTTVTIVLRCISDRDRAGHGLTIEAADADPMRATRPGTRVMLIDDDDDVRVAMVDSLASLGYESLGFADGASALDAFPRVAPALVVLDYAMPVQSGARVAEALRQIQPGLPIIFASGYADSEALDAVADANTRILRKPFRTADLGAMIASLVPPPGR